MSKTTRMVLVDKEILFTVVNAWSKENNFKVKEKTSNSVTYIGGGVWTNHRVAARHDGKIGYLDAWFQSPAGKQSIDRGILKRNPFAKRLVTMFNSLLATLGQPPLS